MEHVISGDLRVGGCLWSLIIRRVRHYGSNNNDRSLVHKITSSDGHFFFRAAVWILKSRGGGLAPAPLRHSGQTKSCGWCRVKTGLWQRVQAIRKLTKALVLSAGRLEAFSLNPYASAEAQIHPHHYQHNQHRPSSSPIYPSFLQSFTSSKNSTIFKATPSLLLLLLQCLLCLSYLVQSASTAKRVTKAESVCLFVGCFASLALFFFVVFFGGGSWNL